MTKVLCPKTEKFKDMEMENKLLLKKMMKIEKHGTEINYKKV